MFLYVCYEHVVNRYTIIDFQRDFNDDAKCLDLVFKRRYPHLKGWKRLSTRKAYANGKGRQIYPLAGTIFEKSSTPLHKWFYVMFLFSHSRHGISAKEVQRHIGVTYKTAWRMCKMIRSLMVQDQTPLTGVVEADETYIGGTRRLNSWKRPKSCVVGAVARGGDLRAKVLNGKGEYDVVPFVEKNVAKGSTLYTDGNPVYNIARGYKRGRVLHSKKEFVKGVIHTNQIEGFWSQVKRGIRGTHLGVSKRYLQSYLDEAVWRYNHRHDVFSSLLGQL